MQRRRKDTITREITPKEFVQECEGHNRFFTIKYKEHGNVIRHTREYKHKKEIRRIIRDPMTTEIQLFLNEWVDTP